MVAAMSDDYTKSQWFTAFVAAAQVAGDDHDQCVDVVKQLRMVGSLLRAPQHLDQSEQRGFVGVGEIPIGQDQLLTRGAFVDADGNPPAARGIASGGCSAAPRRTKRIGSGQGSGLRRPRVVRPTGRYADRFGAPAQARRAGRTHGRMPRGRPNPATRRIPRVQEQERTRLVRAPVCSERSRCCVAACVPDRARASPEARWVGGFDRVSRHDPLGNPSACGHDARGCVASDRPTDL